MSFKSNNYQQVSIFDSFLKLTARERKALENSWAHCFSEDIFPLINEERFSVLYSDKASRPNTPINVIVGALIIKELFDYSDDELVENLMLDLHLQYALHTTSFNEQPLSDKTLSRFRKRCQDYLSETGENLFADCLKELNGAIAKLMGISGRIRRMDSMMIESNIRKLSRMELIYVCISRLASLMYKQDDTILPEELKHYTDSSDYNQFIYHQRSSETDDRMGRLLADADRISDLAKNSYADSEEYKLLSRCLSEQTIVENDVRRLRTKKDGGMNASILQNPTDPEATYRKKAGKEHRGYTANLEEAVGENGTVVLDYTYEPNTCSDSQMLKDHLENMETFKEKVVMVADGAYGGEENVKLAADHNVELITTSLTGKETDPIHSRFEFDESEKEVVQCPAGHKPNKCRYNAKTGQISASFDRECCEHCPYKDQCNAKINKRSARITTSVAAHNRAVSEKFRQTEEFKNFARLRNGVETIPSILRKHFHLDKLPRGIQRGKFFFGAKITGLNFRKLFNFRRGLGNYAQNPVIG